MKRVAIGFFDGVHLGHQAILASADAVVTFRNHPLSVLDPAHAPVLIMSVEERIEAIRACGVSKVVALDFTPELAALEPGDFVDRLMRSFASERLSPSDLVIRCGDNWRFGKGGAGDAAFLRAHGIAVEVPPYATCAGKPISSSRIRVALEHGELAEAAALLGRPFAATGQRQPGKGLGQTLGVPTVNLAPGRPLPVPCGVYVVRVGGVAALANYGLAPTLADRAWREPTAELHFPGRTSADVEALLGSSARLTVEWLRFLRPERMFGSLDALRAQIDLDLNQFRRYENEQY